MIHSAQVNQNKTALAVVMVSEEKLQHLRTRDGLRVRVSRGRIGCVPRKLGVKFFFSARGRKKRKSGGHGDLLSFFLGP